MSTPSPYALTDPLEYFNQYFIFGDQSGDIDDDGDIDFDDIDNFAALIPGMSTTQVLAAIRGMPEQVPEPGMGGIVGCFLAPLAIGRRLSSRQTYRTRHFGRKRIAKDNLS